MSTTGKGLYATAAILPAQRKNVDVEGYLSILMVVDEGEHTIPEVATATGLSETEALHLLTSLESCGFLQCPAGRRARDGLPVGFIVSPQGKRLLRFGFDELYKRHLAEELGGSATEHAS